MDLLAVRRSEGDDPEAVHVEVQTSFRPNNYVARLSRQRAKDLGVGRTVAISRTPDMVREAMQEWVHDKFHHPVKASRREAYWPGLHWRFVPVHAIVKYPEELNEFANGGVGLVYLGRVLEVLCPPQRPLFTASAGADLADLIDFYRRKRSLPVDEISEEADEVEAG